MIRLSQDRSKSMLAIHGWSGVLLGLLLYAVIVTGMISVFADEIGEWSNPRPHHQAKAFPTGLDAKVREIATTVDPKYYEELTLFPRAGGQILAFFHHHVTPEGESLPKEVGVEFKLHPDTLAVLDRREGYAEKIQDFDRANALADFLVTLHVSLHIPDPWGYFVTGILGLAMMVAAVTGLFMHRHLLQELFTIRRLRAALLDAATRTSSPPPGPCRSLSSWRSLAVSIASRARLACQPCQWSRSAVTRPRSSKPSLAFRLLRTRPPLRRRTSTPCWKTLASAPEQNRPTPR